jgi:hypothetical protein
MKLQLTDGSVWNVDAMANGRVKFLGLPVDIRVVDGKLLPTVNGIQSQMKPCTRVLFKDYYLDEGARVTGVMIDDVNAVVNILPYDLYVIQPDGTFYTLPSHKFSDTNLPSSCDGLTFISPALLVRAAVKAGREDLIMRQRFGRTEGRKEIVWPIAERQKAQSSDFPVPYFLE